MKDFESAMDGVAAIALAVYLASVLIHGNLGGLISEVKKETGFFEFIVALFILTQLAAIPGFKPFVGPIALAGTLILAMRVLSGTDVSKFNKFATGQIGLFDLFGSLFSKQA